MAVRFVKSPVRAFVGSWRAVRRGAVRGGKPRGQLLLKVPTPELYPAPVTGPARKSIGALRHCPDSIPFSGRSLK